MSNHIGKREQRKRNLNRAKRLATGKPSPLSRFGNNRRVWQEGESPNPVRPRGKTLLTRVRELLASPADPTKPNGETKGDQAAHSYFMAMLGGSFPHAKEIFEREDGKVPNRIADADGGNLKLYAGLPLDDDEGP